MLVRKSSWHWHVFLGWEGRKKRTSMTYMRPEPLDLCRYMRVVFIYAPWRWFWLGWYSNRISANVMPWVLTLILAAFAAVGVGFAFDAWETGKVLLLMFGSIIAMLAILIGVFYAGEKNMHVAIAKRTRESLVFQYAKAKKRRICPFLDVE